MEQELEAAMQFFHSMPCRDRAWLGWGQGEGGGEAVSQLVETPRRQESRPVLSLCPSARLAPRHLCTVQDGCLCCRWGRGRRSVACVGLEALAGSGGLHPASPCTPWQAAPSGDLEWGQGLEAASPFSAWRPAAENFLQLPWAPLLDLPQAGSSSPAVL